MKTRTLILLCLLAVWWGFVVVKTILVYRKLFHEAKLMTPEELRGYKQDMTDRCSHPPGMAKKLKRLLFWVMMSPFVFALLPYFLIAWIVKDPFEKCR
jgi:hypothetical protein